MRSLGAVPAPSVVRSERAFVGARRHASRAFPDESTERFIEVRLIRRTAFNLEAPNDRMPLFPHYGGVRHYD
jgi:hypothetical protein